MLRHALRYFRIALNKVEVFFRGGCSNCSEQSFLYPRKIALHQYAEHTLKAWRLPRQFFFCFRCKPKHFAIFQCFYKHTMGTFGKVRQLYSGIKTFSPNSG